MTGHIGEVVWSKDSKSTIDEKVSLKSQIGYFPDVTAICAYPGPIDSGVSFKQESGIGPYEQPG